MKKRHLLIASFLLPNIYRTNGQIVKVPLMLNAWDTVTVNRDDSASVTLALETYKGNECLLLQSGMIILKGVDLRDGSIEAELSFPQQHSFPGFAVGCRTLTILRVFTSAPINQAILTQRNTRLISMGRQGSSCIMEMDMTMGILSDLTSGITLKLNFMVYRRSFILTAHQ